MTNTYEDNFARLIGDSGEVIGDRVYFHCPFCEEQHEKRKFNIDPSTGVWYCFRCSEGGSAAKFMELMGDQENEHLWPKGVIKGREKKEPALTAKKQRDLWSDVFSRCTLSARHAEMLEGRGIEGSRCGAVSALSGLLDALIGQWGEETVVRGGLAYRVPNEPLPRCRRCIAPGRLLIPYRDEKEQIIYFVGYAPCPGRKDDETPDDYAQRKSAWVKIAGPSGYPTRVYGSVKPQAPYLVITEGQLKAEAAVQRGFACVGIAGIGNSHKPLVAQCQKQQVQRAIVLFDTQAKNQDIVDYEAMRLAKLLLEAGIPTYRARIPLEAGQEKADIDSYLGTHTAREFAELLAAAGRSPYELEADEPKAEEDEEVSEDTESGMS